MANQDYVSDELSHFVGRGKNPDDQCHLLIEIVKSGCLKAPRSELISGEKIVQSKILEVRGNADFSSGEMYRPMVVCFCDIPIDDASLRIHTSKYSKFGLSFLKDFIVGKGGSPVLYLPRAARDASEIPLDQYFDEMVKGYHQFSAAVENLQDANLLDQLLALRRFLDFRIFSFIKFHDHTLSDGDPNNFYMEREWRVNDSVKFTTEDICKIICPRDYEEKVKAGLQTISDDKFLLIE